jgi:hypothetical protein
MEEPILGIQKLCRISAALRSDLNCLVLDGLVACGFSVCVTSWHGVKECHWDSVVSGFHPSSRARNHRRVGTQSLFVAYCAALDDPEID